MTAPALAHPRFGPPAPAWQIANAILERAWSRPQPRKDPALTPMRLQSLVYLAALHAWWLEGAHLIDERPLAGNSTPYYSSLVLGLRPYRNQPLTVRLGGLPPMASEEWLAAIQMPTTNMWQPPLLERATRAFLDTFVQRYAPLPDATVFVTACQAPWRWAREREEHWISVGHWREYLGGAANVVGASLPPLPGTSP